ncbi:hypothetical protein VNO78_26206 [Psophocarpus tetragonolobus]|uniref:Uncharacterized protein n=1 Tax=Psophocarpus tetragonolobus TaxID=3891 RepID=A0AAN9XAF5_PSOTE
MDKLSILNHAVDYVKYLQNHVKLLEERNKKTSMESVCYFKNKKPNIDKISRIFSRLHGTKTFPNVEARVSAKDVLIRVICDKQNNIVTKLLSKLATYNLSIVCCNVLPFGNSTLDISIIAKVDREFSMAVDDLVKNLNEELLSVVTCNNN